MLWGGVGLCWGTCETIWTGDCESNLGSNMSLQLKQNTLKTENEHCHGGAVVNLLKTKYPTYFKY